VQSLKLGTGLQPCRIIPPRRPDLVGANDNSSSTTARCNLARFRLGKSERAAGRIAPLCPAGLFE